MLQSCRSSTSFQLSSGRLPLPSHKSTPLRITRARHGFPCHHGHRRGLHNRASALAARRRRLAGLPRQTAGPVRRLDRAQAAGESRAAGIRPKDGSRARGGWLSTDDDGSCVLLTRSRVCSPRPRASTRTSGGSQCRAARSCTLQMASGSSTARRPRRRTSGYRPGILHHPAAAGSPAALAAAAAVEHRKGVRLRRGGWRASAGQRGGSEGEKPGWGGEENAL